MHQTKYRPLPIKDRKTAFQMQDVFVRRSTAAGDYLVTCISAGHESADADGFGMEEEYDFHFFDEKQSYLGSLCGWSMRDFFDETEWIDDTLQVLLQTNADEKKKLAF
ncbi:MAG: hypothetical protein J6L88_02385 [Clostridia bacterium]|nr:hypothetical protein [Clostridia bacterium]